MKDVFVDDPDSQLLPTLHRGERRVGNVVKGILLVVGLLALWFIGGGAIARAGWIACMLYGVASVAFTGIFGRGRLPARLIYPLVLASYGADLIFVAILIYLTGGISSDLYLLYVPLALKAAVYYSTYRPIILSSYLIGPLYALACRQAAGGWYFLLDTTFYPRYVLLFGLLFTSTYVAWLLERRQQHIAELTANVNAKARILEETATGLGDRVIELRTLQEGIKAINSSLSLEELLRLIVLNASQVLGVARCSVGLLDENTGEVVTLAASGVPPESLWGSRFKLGQGVAGRVVETGKPVLIGDVRKDSRFVTIGEYPVTSVMCVPLLSDDRAVGALTATSRKPNAFAADDLNLLAAFADQAAIAVQNASLYQRLGAEKQRTEAILQGLGDGVIVTDAGLNLVLLNPSAAHIFGLSQMPGPGAPIRDAIADETLADLFRRACAAKPSPVVGELSLPDSRPDKMRLYHVLTTTVLDESHEVRNVIAVLRDITSRKEVEEMKSNFLSVVSHELKTPLHSIKGFVDIILMGKTGKINDTQKDFLTIVKSQTTNLQNQINDLLEFSRLEAGQVRLRIDSVDLVDVAATVVEKLKPQADDGQIALRNGLAEDFAAIAADRGRIEQVLTNLVDNAIKFTKSGGQVAIEGQDLGESVQLCVRDNGIGIPAEQLPRVFDRFYQVDGTATRAYRGTGLGLTICKHIVEQHHGKMWVESVEGEGSCFFFTLPKQLDTAGEEAALDFAAFPSGTSHT